MGAGTLALGALLGIGDTLYTTVTLRKYYAGGGEPGDLAGVPLTWDSISDPNALVLRLEPSPPRRRPPARVYVVTLQDVPGAAAANQGRYVAFLEAWKSTCGAEIAFVRCPGVVEVPKAYVACIERAIHERTASDDAPVVFMEDDSRLFAEDGGKFCKASARQRLWDAAPSDAFLIMYAHSTTICRNRTHRQ